MNRISLISAIYLAEAAAPLQHKRNKDKDKNDYVILLI